mgnify:FL=1
MPSEDWKARYHTAAGKIAALKQRIADLESSAAAGDAVQAQQRQKIEQLGSRLSEQGRSLDYAKTHALRSHRSILSAQVVRRSLPLRLTVAQARARQPEAIAADTRFQKASTSYAAAVAAAARPPDSETPILRNSLQGLHWWVPVLRPRDAEPGSPWLQKQKFPYRGIRSEEHTSELQSH